MSRTVLAERRELRVTYTRSRPQGGGGLTVALPPDRAAFLTLEAPGLDPGEIAPDLTGETITDTPERTVRILADLPELVVTWSRYVPGEEGPGPHIHREHSDSFFLLSGALVYRLGPELEPVAAGPGTFVLAPPEVVHTFRNEGTEEATWLNFHAPSANFAAFLRDTSLPWDSFDAPGDGGRPLSEAIVRSI